MNSIFEQDKLSGDYKQIREFVNVYTFLVGLLILT